MIDEAYIKPKLVV